MAASHRCSFIPSLLPLLWLTACAPDGGADGSTTGVDSNDGVETSGDSNSNSDSNSDSNSGDGDGDPGDGDGDPGDGDGDPGDGGSNTKFDLPPLGDLGDGQGGWTGPGSCRASETYGASGNFPMYEDPAYANFLDRTVAIVTHNNWDGPPNNYSLTIVDISGDPPPPNMNYLAPLYHRPEWTLTGALGKNFGLTLDSYGNMYLAATTVWGANSTPSEIKKIDAVTGEISVFASLPNNGPAFGNLNYDCVSETIYVSNHEDGRIYQIDMDGDIVSTYHHTSGNVTMGPANDQGEPNGAFAPLGQRPWAVQSHAGRLYYSIWAGGGGNTIWSVAYTNDNGVPDAATATMEFQTPGNQPVSDLSFAHNGFMLVAQRTMSSDMQTGAHQSTTFEYDYQNGDWIFQGTTYIVGELLPYSAAGGVDHDFVENGYVWMTGDALDFYTPNVVYGLQGTPHGGGGIEVSTLIDLDHEITQQDKTVYGDVELPIPGDVSPVPPPG
ncbi:hypothetical protein [Enhygromyxa salina]|uniref:Endo-1,4-beta-xylanase A n=1 Tax=Enhygromyxa salina TaxID=215803 RepID=A0A2S9YVH7_9BACT|nr:hypothetical protein [Enhygromyxa salina]PRQ09084.1 hypothetical protein ENSA7_10740 [Enhygromyxa salina]